MTAVKICGIKTPAQALAALEAGADYLGFNFYPPSPRSVTPEVCAQILAELPAGYEHVKTVGVFVNHPVEGIQAIVERCGLDLVQLSGDEAPQAVDRFPGRAFKALRPHAAADLERLLEVYLPYSTAQPAFLLDARVEGAYGGTGKRADWELASGLARRCPIFLAGGLDAENVYEAVRQVRPWGVDVASGVESASGEKEPRLVKAFVQAVRRADAA